MYVITTIIKDNGKDLYKGYFKGYVWGFPNFTLNPEEAKQYKTKKSALQEKIRNTEIEKIGD